MSGKIVDYKVVTGCDPYSINTEVYGMIHEGWKLYGTPFGFYDDDLGHSVICQAMVKEVYNNHKEAMR